MIESALRYAAAGVAIFPCGGKFPFQGSHGCKDATTDPDEVRRMWARYPGANVAIATGRGLMVIDVDPRHRGDESLARLEAERGQLVTVTSRTPSGGAHYWLAVPDGIVVGCSNKRLVDAFGPGLDCRGQGGYALVPPSVSALGDAYVWVCREPLLTAPAWLLDLTEKREPARTVAIPARSLAADQDGTPYGLRALEREADDVRNAPEGGRNAALNRAAFRCAQLIAGGELAQTVVEHELTAAALAAGLTLREARGVDGNGGTIASGFKAGLAYPRGATHAA